MPHVSRIDDVVESQYSQIRHAVTMHDVKAVDTNDGRIIGVIRYYAQDGQYSCIDGMCIDFEIDKGRKTLTLSPDEIYFYGSADILRNNYLIDPYWVTNNIKFGHGLEQSKRIELKDLGLRPRCKELVQKISKHTQKHAESLIRKLRVVTSGENDTSFYTQLNAGFVHMPFQLKHDAKANKRYYASTRSAGYSKSERIQLDPEFRIEISSDQLELFDEENILEKHRSEPKLLKIPKDIQLEMGLDAADPDLQYVQGEIHDAEIINEDTGSDNNVSDNISTAA